MQWRVVTYRLAADNSRHRVGVWREMRRVGAVAVQSATWVIPTGDRFDEGLQKALRLVERAGGQALVLDVAHDCDSLSDLEALYTAERDAEWAEFAAECDKAMAELADEITRENFTPAELEEEEHNVERLRRWHRELRAKDLFGAPASTSAEDRLKQAAEILDDFAERVYQARRGL